MRSKQLLLSIVTFLLFIVESFPQNQQALAKQELTPLEIPHYLKVDSLGNIEKWTIGNLQLHPHHVLKIYDRRGVKIFQSKKYENDWPIAHYTENRFLFVLDIDDKRINGWVEIER